MNGSAGIGTGWSTQIPCYNPRDIIANLKRLIAGDTQQTMHPWYAGFKGKIVPDSGGRRYVVSGIWQRIDDRTLEITELPVGTWTQDYKEFLMTLINPDEKKKTPPFLLKDMKEYHTDTSVHFVVESMEDLPADAIIEKTLKLSTYLSVANMTLFDSEGRIRQWDSATAILDDFFTLRLQYYDKRKDYLVETLREEWKRLDNKVRFILAVVNKEIIISNRKKADILKELREKSFDPFPTKAVKSKKKTAGGEVAVDSDESEGEEGEDTKGSKDTKPVKKESVDKSSKDYDYLLSMSLWNLTLEKVQELVRQRDTKNEELKVLIGTSAKQLWLSDLTELETTLDARDAVYAEEQDASKSLKKKGSSKLKTRKSRKTAKVVSDDDDYSAPKGKGKTAAAPKKPTPSIPKPAPSKAADKEKKSGIRNFFGPAGMSDHFDN